MSMTREEARIELQAIKDTFEEYEPGGTRCQMALKVALTALRPVSREQVEKVKGEWIWDTNGLYPKPVCSKCGEEPYRRSNHTSDLPNYCPKCGCPMTDEAVDILLKRLEALKDGKGI